MAFATITVKVGGLTVGVGDYENSATTRVFKQGDTVIRFFSGKTFQFPNARNDKGRQIILVNKQTVQSIQIQTNGTDAESPITLSPGCKISAVSDGDLWLMGI